MYSDKAAGYTVCKACLLFAEHHRLYMPAEVLQGRSAIAAAAAPCLIWVWKLLLSLASFHAQQKAASMAALQAHKDYTRLLKAGDKFITDETEHNRLLDKAEDKRNFAHQERSSLQSPIDRANAELGRQWLQCCCICPCVHSCVAVLCCLSRQVYY